MDSSVFIAQTKMFPIDNYLPLTFKRSYSRTVPVYMSSWDTCDEFFEFEVKNTLDPNNNECIQYEMKTCHICNIDVPKLFIKEHCQSNKHLMFKKIANTALTRMRNHMNDVDESTPDYIANVYFCSTCVAVVKISDKDYHTRQQSHKNSLIADKLLNDFLSLYTHYNDDNDKENLDSAEDSNVQDDSNNTVKLDTSNNTDLSLLVPNDVTDNESNNITTNKKQLLDSNRKEPLHTIDEIVIKGVNRKQSSNLKQQAEAVNIWNKTESNNVLNEAEIHDVVKPIDNLKYEENKYSQLLKDNKIQDSKENMIDANKPGNRSKAVSKVQEINEENDSGETNEELTLMNKEETQKNKDELKTDDTERNNSQSSETKDLKIKDENRATNKITNTQQLPDLNTSPENLKIGNTIAKDLFESHNNALKDLNAHKIKMISENYMEIQCTDGAKVCVCSDNYFGFRVEPKEIIYCEICTESFVLDKQFKHIKKKHMHDLIAPLENKHCLRNLVGNIYHCVLCNDVSDDPNRHINTKYHEIHLEKALIKKDNTNTEIEIKDEPWDVIFYDELDSPATERPEVDDDENVIDNIKISSERISLQEDNIYNCDSCKTDIHVNDIKLHVNSSIHKMNKISNVHYMMEDMDINLLCKVCQERIYNERTSITNHVNNMSHKNAYKDLLDENWIEKFDGQLHCRMCMEYIQEKNELLHINSKKHNICIKTQIKFKYLSCYILYMMH